MQERRALFRRMTPGVEPQNPIPDPRGDLPDLTGHPIARGCKECRKYNQDCSMTLDGKYPCTPCFEDGTQCQPIVEPKIRGAGRCDLCEQRGIQCSYEVGGMGAICDQCLDSDNVDCIAGPLSTYTVDRIDLERILYGPERKYAACTYCRTHRKRCSLKKKEDKPPCKSCKKHGIGCTFYEVKSTDSSKKVKGKDKTVEASSRKRTNAALPEGSVPHSEFFNAEDLADLKCKDDEKYEREDTPEMEMEDAEGRRGPMTKIRTSFAHPIKFYTMEDDAPDCNFCELPVFGFVGHFEKTIHVIKWDTGLGFTELAAGHREEHDATTMCQNCTFTRLQIIACPGHIMQSTLEALATQDFDSAAQELLDAEPRSPTMQYQLQRWCSMCFSLATFKCCTPQPSITGQSPDEDEDLVDGCGLRLCDRCESEYLNVWEGNFQGMLARLQQEPKAREEDDLGGNEQAIVRADVEFLSMDGLLMKNVDASGVEE
jgi:hypothetical protein